jgi:hypothetical protein
MPQTAGGIHFAVLPPTKPMKPPRDPLEHLLENWRDAPPPAGTVAPEVWRRIAATNARKEQPDWLTRLEAVFARPSFAFVFVTACVLLGLFLAEARVSRLQAERNVQMARQYLRLIDPAFTENQSRGTAAAPRS